MVKNWWARRIMGIHIIEIPAFEMGTARSNCWGIYANVIPGFRCFLAIIATGCTVSLIVQFGVPRSQPKDWRMGFLFSIYRSLEKVLKNIQQDNTGLVVATVGLISCCAVFNPLLLFYWSDVGLTPSSSLYIIYSTTHICLLNETTGRLLFDSRTTSNPRGLIIIGRCSSGRRNLFLCGVFFIAKGKFRNFEILMMMAERH